MEAIVKPSNLSIFHRHNWKFIKKVDTTWYSECTKCGARKAPFFPEHKKTIRWSWLSGQTNMLKSTPVRKDKTCEK